ncbi:MAG TPA: acyltransferase family protein [Candidatus Dormibacteraeota bacterium]|nr:acyltransferase family protein [Candidatus Dormibacteraeota bacterium]
MRSLPGSWQRERGFCGCAEAKDSWSLSSVPAGQRIHYLDWLKVLIVYGIFVYHVALVFVVANWLVSNHERIPILSIFVALTFPWGIPAMFLISGADAWFGLRRRSARHFIWQRVLRLLLPMAAGLAVLSPFQRFVTSQNPPPSLDQLPAYYMSFFRDFHFIWSMQWVSKYWLHLWFLGYLFVISIACLPLVQRLRSGSGPRITGFVLRIAIWRGGLLLLALPLAVLQVILRPHFPGYQDWADVATYTYVFLWGALLVTDRRFEAAIRRDIHLILLAAIIAALGSGYIFLTAHLKLNLTASLDTPATLSFAILWTFEVWCWLLAVLYPGIRWLDFPNRVISYLEESILPFYVLHHPVLLAVASYVVTWRLGAWPKFFAILVIGGTITMTLYEYGVRRWNLMRTIFGLRPLPSPQISETLIPVPVEVPSI